MFRNLFYVLIKTELSQEPYGTKYIFYKLHFSLLRTDEHTGSPHMRETAGVFSGPSLHAGSAVM